MPTGVFGACKNGRRALFRKMMTRLKGRRNSFFRGRKTFYNVGAPTGGVDNPTGVGDLYIDTSNNKVYVAQTYSADGTGTGWIQIA